MHEINDPATRALNFLDTKIEKVRSCIESYLDKGNGKLNNITVVTIFRTVESEVIRQCGLPENHMMHNLLRMHMLDKLLVD